MRGGVEDEGRVEEVEDGDEGRWMSGGLKRWRMEMRGGG